MEAALHKSIEGLVRNSSLARDIAPLKARRAGERLFGAGTRPLTDAEIRALIAHGNTCTDWRAILVSDGFITDFIRGSFFTGVCVIGVFTGTMRESAPGVSFPSGIYNSTIADAEIGNECLIKECGLIAHYIVDDGAVLFRVDELSAGPGCSFGNGVGIPIGSESGARTVTMCAELDFDLASHIALRRGDMPLLSAYEAAAVLYRETVTCDFGYVGKGGVVRNTRAVRKTYLGPGALVDGAILIENCTILSCPDERSTVCHGAVVCNSCLGPGGEISSMAIVSDSLLTEHTHVERHGKVHASIIGPNTGIAEGEVTSCLLGPFVAFHHQALLIAALWPEGKGNVAYGANVGSNHTSRAPDQEIFCGEGVFFGLGTNVKFPADLSHAPYSIIATGVTTLPQKIEFPFSLISAPDRVLADLAPAFNEISPGWVLSDNIYMVLRNEEKYRMRNRAKRHTFVYEVFRPKIIDLMEIARDRLRSAGPLRSLYTENDIPGLGKNYLTEKKRLAGAAAYDFYLEYYALNGLFLHLRERHSYDTDTADVYERRSDDRLWEHQRALLVREGWNRRSVKDNLLRLAAMLDEIAENAFRVKKKDDERGERIIPDYSVSAVTADEDGFIKRFRAQTADVKRMIDESIQRLRRH